MWARVAGDAEAAGLGFAVAVVFGLPPCLFAGEADAAGLGVGFWASNKGAADIAATMDKVRSARI